MSEPIFKHKTLSLDHRLVRISLFSFLITFISLRTLVFCIMKFKAYYMYVFIDGKHIHHFSDGFIILSLLSGYLIFFSSHKNWLVAVIYGVALGLTFDEFGMWICLNINYWQRSSFYAVALISTFLGLLAYAPSLKKLRLVQIITLILLIIGIFTILDITGKYLRSTNDKTLLSLLSKRAKFEAQNTPADQTGMCNCKSNK